MPLAKPSRRKPATSSRSIESDASFRRLTPPPLPSLRRHSVTKLPLAVSVTAFLSVIAVIIGTMAAHSMQRDDNMLRADLERTQTQLLQRLQRLEEFCKTPAPLPTPVNTSPTSAALPVTVTAAQMNEMRVRVDIPSWNSATATETVEYRDTVRNITLRLPYNPKWGNEMYKLAPFDLREGGAGRAILEFGPVIYIPGQNGYFARKYTLEVSTDTRLSDEERRSGSAKRIGTYDLTLIELPKGRQELVFIGKKYRYSLWEQNTDSGNGPMSDATVLSILRTLRSI